MGRPPFGRPPPRDFGGPMIRGGIKISNHFSWINFMMFYLGRGRPPFRGGYGYDGDFSGNFLQNN